MNKNLYININKHTIQTIDMENAAKGTQLTSQQYKNFVE